MLGAIIGDIAGSRYEWNNIKTKDFELLNSIECFFTDDTVMTLAIAKSLLECDGNYNNLSAIAIKNMVEIGRKYPDCGFGGNFYKWIMTDDHSPYNSFGNGAAMRVSACCIVGKNIDEVKELSRKVTEISHNHPEGIKGAEAVACAIFMAINGKNMFEIRDFIQNNYYDLNFKLDDIRNNYTFDVSCQGTVPQAFEAFFESTSFEDAIRNAISIGGDSDTIAAITGSIAGVYFGIPTELRKKALTFLNEELLKILLDFENKYPPKLEVIKNSISVSIVNNERTKISTDNSRNQMIEDAFDVTDEDFENSLSKADLNSSKKLFNHLYGACNILRGPINQDEFKSYVTPILFFKRISDVYDEETELALNESGGDEEYAKFDENHRFIIPDGCHWNDVRNTTENVGSAIVKAMSGIERANPDTLNGLFSSFDDANWTDKSKLSDSRLKDLIEHMSSIKVGNNNYSADVMGDAYEYLIKKFADLSKKNAGEFYTPRPIVKLLVNLIDPKPGEEVYDPACGTGGMLIEAIHHINNDKFTYGKIYGQEKNLSTSAIARMNMFLHGGKDFKVSQGDTLVNPVFLRNGKVQKFDCVIANPPFGLSNWGAKQFSSDPYGRNIWGTPSDSNADFAWLQHMVSSMKEKTGRCAVILPQGILFHKGKDLEMRNKLLQLDIIETIIILVKGVFFATNVTACILLLNNNKKTEHKNKICLIDASKIYTAKRAQNIMTEKNIEDVFKLYEDYVDVPGKCKIVNLEDIDDTLVPKNYIDMGKVEGIDYKKIYEDYVKEYNNMTKLEEKTEKILKEGGFLNE